MASKKKRKVPPKVLNTKSKFEILSDGRHSHTVKTPYGTIVYTYSPKILSGILAGMFTVLLGRAFFNHPLKIQQLIEMPENEPPYEYLFSPAEEPELLAQREQYTEYASELLWRQAPQLLIESSEQLIQEVVVRTIRELQDQAPSNLSPKLSELLKLLTTDILARMKLRVNARPQGGSTADWTPERKRAFLAEYENAHRILKNAKRIYRQNRNENWRAMIRVAYPQLPEDLIDKLPLKGKTSEPRVLAYEYAAATFNVECNDYLPKIVAAARKMRK
jgi:hypothetical protein